MTDIFNRLFIVGYPRSGTTLVSSLLSASGKIAITPESHFLNVWLQEYKRVSLNETVSAQDMFDAFILSNRFSYFGIDATEMTSCYNSGSGDPYRRVFDCLLRCFQTKVQADVIGEKTPAHYAHVEKILEWFPNCKIVWVIRNPFSVYNSLKSVPWGNSGVQVFCRNWKQQCKLLDQQRLRKNIFLIRYEDVVIDQRDALSPIFDAFHLSDAQYEPATQRSMTNMGIEQRNGWAKEHLLRAASPIDNLSVDKWKTELRWFELRIIKHELRNEIQDLGYPEEVLRKSAILDGIAQMLSKMQEFYLKLKLLVTNSRARSVLLCRLNPKHICSARLDI